MTINYSSFKTLPSEFYDGIKRLLVLTDNEFVPPLSSRTSTTQSDLHFHEEESSGEHSITLYFNALLKQRFIVATVDNNIAGFISFIKDHTVDDVVVPSNNAYVSTICVDPEYRRRGITNEFYNEIEADPENHFVFTRTWSKNDSHIHLLLKRDYKLIHEVIDGRAEGINTVYYAKELMR